MTITRVAISNFRSILELDENVSDLNIFVGQNDEGKSNILRALDLFFNSGKIDGYEFDWARDYSSFAIKRVRKAEEIEISLTIVPPASFAKRAAVSWTKIWRRDGLHLETVVYEDGTEIAPKSKIWAFLKAMRFDYVPAIKGRDYFQALMSKLHDMLEATVEERVREASGSFTKTINENTKPILAEILSRLGLETTIELPANLRSLFAQLEFTSISAARSFSLNQRGDGIKVRHIPIVLRWLAQQANHLSAPGRPKTVTVWGYEEPENNLELRRCFDLAKDFIDGSGEIQTFVTTHSPAFYSVFRDSDQERVHLYLVTKGESPPTTEVARLEALTELASLDTSMGLLALVEPHFREIRRELASLRSSMKHVTDHNRPTIFCEGPTDVQVLSEALRLFFPKAANKVAIRHSAHHGGGHTWVEEMLIAWSYSRPLAKAVGLFDKDAEAQASAKKANERIRVPPSGKTAFPVSLEPSTDLKECYRRKLRIPFAIEELFPESAWDYAEGMGWLEDRPNLIALYGFKDCAITFNDFIRAALPEPQLQRIATRRVKLSEKVKFASWVVNLQPKVERERVLAAIKPTLEAILDQLGIDAT